MPGGFTHRMVFPLYKTVTVHTCDPKRMSVIFTFINYWYRLKRFVSFDRELINNQFNQSIYFELENIEADFLNNLTSRSRVPDFCKIIKTKFL